MGVIEKGVILSITGKEDRNGNKTKASVQNASAEGTTTMPLTIPWYLRGKMGNLTKGTEVVYSVFNDETGIILARADGEWDGDMEDAGDITVGNITVGNITADNITADNVENSTEE